MASRKSLNLVVIGAGYVGLVSGACLAAIGHRVICVDTDQEKIKALESGEIPIYEPGLDGLVQKAVGAGNLSFSADLKSAMRGQELALIAVGTPSIAGEWRTDLSVVFEVVRQLAKLAGRQLTVIMKSTVPVGTQERLLAEMRQLRPDCSFAVVSNPEFLREGSAIQDFMKADRIVVGVDSQAAEQTLRQLYQPLTDAGIPLVVTDPRSSEMIKYASNCYLAMRIAFLNQLSDLCEVTGANVTEVAIGAGLDKRIGTHYFQPGPGYGGSCFPKDTRGLVALAEEYGSSFSIIKEVIAANDKRIRGLFRRVQVALGGVVAGKVVAILGIAFKKDTDDLRDAPSLTLIPELQRLGAQVKAYDPIAMKQGAKVFKDVIWSASASEALQSADCAVLLTEWDEFRALDLGKAAAQMRTPVLVDFRNLFDPAAAAAAGFVYSRLGLKVDERAAKAAE